MIKLLASIMATVLLVACGSPPPRLPQALESAQTADKDARRALRMGDLAHAKTLFAQSMAQYQSVDDVHGAASALISLATVSHRLHDDEVAIKLLDRMLFDRPGVYSREWQSTAAFRKAVILVDMGRAEEAAAVLVMADRLCASDCAVRHGLAVLRARLVWLKGDATAALELAKPVASNRDANEEEQANALRIVAAAEEKLAQHEAALTHYQAALELDKSLGLSRRIAMDLDGIARTLAALGRAEEAASYAARAALVHEAAAGNATAAMSLVP